MTKRITTSKRSPTAFFLPSWAAERVSADKAQEILTVTRNMTKRGAACSVYVNSDTRKYFFTTGHIFMFSDFVGKRGFVPVTHTIPHNVAPRPGVDDGWVETVAQLAQVYMKGMTEIDPVVEWPELAADEVEV